MASLFANLAPELQITVVKELPLVSVMELCTTSKRIRQNRCRHLYSSWFRANVPDAFNKEKESPYKFEDGPGTWIRLYTESAVERMTNILVKLATPPFKTAQEAVKELGEFAQWASRIQVDKLPLRSARNWMGLVTAARSQVGSLWLALAHGSVTTTEDQAVRVILILRVVLQCPVLADSVGCPASVWRSLIVRFRYGDGGALQKFAAPKPILPTSALHRAARTKPFVPSEIQYSASYSTEDWLYLSGHGLMTLEWDDINTRLSTMTAAGEINFIRVFRYLFYQNKLGEDFLREGLLSASAPAIRRVLVGFLEELDRRKMVSQSALPLASSSRNP